MSKSGLFKLLLSGLFTLTCFLSHASHFMGADLTYDYLGNGQYRFTLKFYRDCAGIAAPGSVSINLLSASCGINNNLTLNQVSSQEVSPICPAQLGQTTCNGGNLQGVQQYIYTGVVNLQQCTDWIFSYSDCCRNGAITNSINPAGTSWYVEATLNNVLAPNNSSPDFTTPPVPYICAGQNFTYNHGVIDPNGNAITYTLIDPRSAPGTPVPYVAGFSAIYPISTTNGVVTFNNNNGQMTLTPNVPQVGIVTVLVQEFNAQGQLIGSVVRDMQVVVINCGNNNAPVVTGPNNISGGTFANGAFVVCQGGPFSFSLNASDADPGQILNIVTNAALATPGAVVTLTGAGNNQTINYSWTPPPGANGIYNITFTIEDNFCPITGTQYLGYEIQVIGVDVTTSNAAICPGQTLTLNLNATGTPTGGTYTWSPAGGLSDPNIANPTATVNAPTTYTVTYVLNGCTSTDQFVIAPAVNTVQINPATATLCTGMGQTVTLNASFVQNGVPLPNGGITFTWSPGGGLNTTNGPTVIANPNAPTTYTVTADTGNGCTASGTVTVNVVGGVNANFNLPAAVCNTSPILDLTTYLANNATPGGTWSGTGVVGTTFDPAVVGNGIYVITYTVGSPPCQAVVNDTMQVNDQPSVAIVSTPNVGCNTFVLTAIGNGVGGNPNGAVYYVRTNTGGEPWGQQANVIAMDNTFGAGNWTLAFYETLNVGTVFSPNTRFVYLEGGDYMANEMNTFVTANITAVQNWVNAGGRLLMNAAPNEGGNMNWGFGGVVCNYPQFSTNVFQHLPVHPVYNGPFLPTSTSYTGNYYLHSYITGPGITSVLDHQNLVNPGLCYKSWGGGLAWFGGMTTHNFHTPAPQAQNFKQNVLAYIANTPLANFNYLWSTGATTSNITVNASGTYTVTISQGGGCTNTASIVITVGAVPTVTIAGAGSYCASATLTANPVGADPPYTYLWSNTDTSQVITVTTSGTYTVTVSGTNGCTATANAVVTILPAPVLALTQNPPIACGVNQVTLTATVTGGGQACNYTVSTIPNNFVACGPNAGPTGDDAVTGANNIGFNFTFCGTVYTQFGISTNGNIQLGPAGYSASFGNAPFPNGTFTRPTIAIAWDDLFADAGDITWGTFGVAPNRTLVVCYNNVAHLGGVGSGNITFGRIILYETTNIVEIHCQTSNNFVSATQGYQSDAVTGTTIRNGAWGSVDARRISPLVPATFVWNNGATTQAITVNANGTYTVTATGANGCTATMSQVVNLGGTAPTVTISGGPTICTSGEISTVVTGGNVPYSYLWNNGETSSGIFITTSGTYTVTVTTVDGCTATASVPIVISPPIVGSIVPNPLNGPYCGGALTLSANGVGCGNGAPQIYTQSFTSGATPVAQCTAWDAYRATLTGSYLTLNVRNNLNPGFTLSDPATVQAIANALRTGTAGTFPFGGQTWAVGVGCGPAGAVELAMNNGGVCACGSVYSLRPCIGNSNWGGVNTTTCGAPTQTMTVEFIPAGAPCTYLWSTGETTQTITPGANGTYTVTITSVGACSATASYNVVVGASPTVNITGGPNFCGPGTITANAGGVGPFTYLWTGGATTAALNVTTSGTYTVTVTNQAGCTATASLAVVVGTQPVASIAVNPLNGPYCGGNVTLTASGGPGGVDVVDQNQPSNTTCMATFGQTGLAQSFVPTANTICRAGIFIASGAGTGSVTISLYNNLPNAGGVMLATGTVANIAANMWAEVSWAPVTVTPGVTYYLVFTGTNTGLCVAGNTANPYPNGAVYANNYGLFASYDYTFRTYSGCAGGVVFNYLWNTGATTAAITINTSGTYVVTVSSGGCTATASQTINIATPPTVTISGGPTFCGSGTITANPVGGTSPYTYAWTGGLTTQAINVVASGTYNVTVTSADGCTATASAVITVNPIPSLTIAASPAPPYCGGNITLTANAAGGVDVIDQNQPSNTTCMATFGQAGLAQSFRPTANTICRAGIFIASGAGTGSVTISLYNNLPNAGGVVLATGTVNNIAANMWAEVSWAPVAVTPGTTYYLVFTGTNAALCVAGNTANPYPNGDVYANNYGLFSGFDYTFRTYSGCAGGGVVSYLWSTGATTQAITVNTSGTYTVTATSNGCTASASQVITVTPIVATASNTGAYCAGSTIQLNATGGVSYAWSGPNGYSNNTQNPTLGNATVAMAGVYTVTVTDNGCTATASTTVVVNANPGVTISGTNAICAGATTTFTASGASTYVWSDGSLTASITANTAGTYTVTGTDANGCTGSATVTLTVNPLPVVSISGNNVICADGSTTFTASGANTYVWSTGDLTASITANTAGTYTVTGTDANGCTGSATVTLTVNPLPVVSISGNNVICADGSTTFTAAGAVSYVWSTGALTASITANTAGTYTVTGTDANGCTGSATVTLTVNPLPVVSISGTDIICADGSTTFTAAGAVSYVWSDGSLTASITANTAGTYTVTGTDANGCTGSATVTLTVNPLPVVSISGTDIICADGSTTFTAAGAVSYVWSDGSLTASITTNTAGTYTVTGTDANGCTGSATVTLTVNPLPVVSISGTDVICADGVTTFTAAGAVSYVWNDGSLTASITTNTAGTYTVTGTDANGCTGSATVTLTVNPLPVVSISGTDIICADGVTTFTAAGATSYVWSDGSVTASITANLAGTYSVTGTDANGCTGSASVVLTVNPNPIVTISGTDIICADATTTFTAAGATSYVWSDGSLTASITTNIPGVYSVTGTDANGCTGSATVTLTVNPMPNITNVVGTPQSCPIPLNDGSIDITATIVAGTLEYSIDNGATFQVSGTFTGLGNGSYNIIVRDPATGCTTIFVGNPVILNGPTFCTEICDNLIDDDGNGLIDCLDPVCEATASVSPAGPTTFCAGGNVTLDGGPAGAASYVWSTAETTQSINVTTSGTYVLTVTNVQGCSASAQQAVTVNPNPVVAISGIDIICAGTTTVFTAAGANTYVWSTGEATADITVGTAGTYSVTGTDVNGCTGTASVVLTVNPLPVVTITGPANVCAGLTGTLTANGAVNYVWGGGEVTNTIVVSTSGTYTVTGTDANGCTGSATFNFTVFPATVVNITGTTTICAGEVTTLTGTGGVSYIWSNGETTASITANAPGTYDVTGTDANGCTASASAVLTVNPVPVVSISGNTILCAGELSTLTASGAISYVWSDGTTNTDITTGVAGTYSVTGTDANGCTGSATVTVIVNPLPAVAINGPTAICFNDIATLTAFGAQTYVWSTGEVTATITTSNAGTYDVTGTDANGCTGSATLTLIVNPLPVVAVAGQTVICADQVATFTASGATGYVWSNGETSVSITANTSGTYTVTGTDANGCSQTASITLLVNPTPSVAIAGPTVICDYDVAQLDASGAIDYVWSTGETTASITTATTGTYSVTGTDANGCTASASLTLTVNPAPIVAINGNNVICADQTATFTATGAVSYVWSTGDLTATIVTNTGGVIGVTGTDANGCTASASVILTVNPLPIATASNTGPYCAGQTIQLDATGGTGYAWSGPLTFNSNLSNPTILNAAPNQAGTYIVTVTDANGCSNTASTFVSVNANPVLAINGNNSICQGLTASFTASGANAYVWSTGDATATITANTSGTYIVTGTNGFGCSAVDSVVLTVHPTPVVTIAGINVICPGASTTLTGTGGISYVWSTGELTAAIVVSDTGYYNITGTDAFGCTASAFVELTNTAAISVNAAIFGLLCPGDSVTVVAAGGATYLWNTGATTNIITVGDAGQYSVTGTDLNGCSNADTVNVAPANLPTISITPSPAAPPYCGIPVTLTVDATGGGFAGNRYYLRSQNGEPWGAQQNAISMDAVFGAGNWALDFVETANAATIFVPGTQFVFLEGSDFIADEMNAFLQTNLTLIENWVANGGNFFVNAAPNEGGNINYGFGGVLLNYSGNYIPNTQTVGAHPIFNGPYLPISPTYTGNFYAHGFVNGPITHLVDDQTNPAAAVLGFRTWGNGLAYFGSMTTTNWHTPNPHATNLRENLFELLGGAPAVQYTYYWNTGDTTPVITATQSGTYTVTVSIGGNCTVSTSINITIGTIPTVTISGGPTFCGPGVITANVANGPAPYTYAWGGGFNTQSINVNNSGIRFLSITDANGCTASAQQLITVNAIPSISITGQNSICAGETGTLNAQGASSYVWSTGDVGPSITYNTAGTYSVTGTTAAGCTNTATINVTVNALPVAVVAPPGSILDCNTVFLNLDATGSQNAISYTWSGPGIVSGGGTATPTVDQPGTYAVTVTSAANCTASASVNVQQDTVSPVIQIANIVDATCNGVCNGAIFLNVSGTGPFTYNWSGGLAAVEDPSNVCAGTYSLTVTGANGCTGTIGNITVTEFAAIAISVDAISDVVCNGACDGTISITATGGDGNYIYNWSNGSTNEDPTGVCAGILSVTVTDASGCTGSLGNITVNEPPVLDAVVSSVVNLQCFNQCIGGIDISVSGGVVPYTFLWSNGETTEDLTNLCAGNYFLTVTDGNGCSVVVGAVTITEPLPLQFNLLSTTDVSCFGACDGAINTDLQGGTPSYTYTWTPALGNVQNPTNVCAGTYDVQVVDGNGCTAEILGTVITEPTALALTVQTVVDVLCAGACTGTATVDATGGTPGYSYLWPDGQTGASATGLCAGSFTVTVTDAHACTAIVVVNIAEPAPLAATTVVTPVNCFGGADGGIDISVSGGVVPYAFAWSNSETTEDVTALTAGLYTVTVTDANGCTAVYSAVVAEPTLLTVSGVVTDVSCNGGSNGSIDLTVTGGTVGYLYSWSNLQATEDINSLSPGTYDVTVTDANGCTATGTYTVDEPTLLVINVTGSTDASCSYSCDAVASALASGGTPFVFGYIYSWSVGQASPSATGLCAGTYTVTATDAGGCTATTSVTIDAPTPILGNITTTPVSCYGASDGTATATASGGTGPYIYTWSNGNIGPFQPNLPRGGIEVTITDANGCTASAASFVASPNPIFANATTTDATCFGLASGTIALNPSGGTAPYTYAWSNGQTSALVVGIAAGTILSVTMTDANGCSGSATGLTVGEPLPVTVSAAMVDEVTCFGLLNGSVEAIASGGTPSYSYEWNNFVNTGLMTGVGAGTYSVTATDVNGCSASTTATVTQPAPLFTSFSQTDVLCNGQNSGSILVDTFYGGVSPYTLNYDGTDFPNINTGYQIDGLAAGTYPLYVTDANGCVDTTVIMLVEPPQVVLYAGTDTTIQLGDSVHLDGSVMNLPANSLLAWTPVTDLSCSDCLQPTASPIETTLYTLTWTDPNGCSGSDDVLVTVQKNRNVFIPTGFTPNGDGLNDFFGVYGGTGVTRVVKMMVFDRWGELLYSAENFLPNNPNFGWDGTFKGKDLNPSVFVYYIEIEFEDAIVLPYQGDVSLIR